jgi:hypothetical protein
MKKRPQPLEFTKECLILCEGSSDKAFFTGLINNHDDLPDFQVQFPLGADEETGGYTKYGEFLKNAPTATGFSVLKAVLIVADNDDCPEQRFQEIQAQLRQTAKGYGIPKHPLEVAKSSSDLPSIAVMMLPLDGQHGNLETICLIAAYDRWPELKTPLDEYVSQTHANEWNELRQAKMRVQCLLAATCQQNPYTTLSTLWTRPEQYHIPLDHPCFEDIVNALRGFGNSIGK